MREIKFRAWHKKEYFIMEPKYIKHLDWNDETIYYVGGNYRAYELDNRYNLCYFWKGDIFVDKNEHVCDVLFEDIELMQYTGLKDKNGVEIYESDIVVYDDTPYNAHASILIGVIKMENLSFKLISIKQDSLGYRKMLLGNDDFFNKKSKVIGNIYENPELLEQNK